MTLSEPTTFLIVDDDAADRAILGRLLHKTYPDAAITEASGIAEVRALDRPARFDVAFLDFVMPRVDGLAALRELEHDWPYTAFIIVTGLGDERIAAEAIKLGAADYVPKHSLGQEPIQRLVEGALEKTRLRQRLDVQLRDLKGLAHTLIHDIRAPIRHLRFLCSEVMDAVARQDRGQATESLRGIDTACERMSDLLAALVQHIEADESFAMEPVDLDTLVAEVLDDLSEEISFAGGTVRQRALPEVAGDAGQLRRLFGGLVRNALRHRGDRPPEIEIAAVEGVGARAHLLVRDNGVGIEPQYLDVIFEPFRRLHAEDGAPGRGLGLATCSKIAAHHGGRIWCDSTPGEGSAFHVTLEREAAGPDPAEGGDLPRLTRLLGEG